MHGHQAIHGDTIFSSRDQLHSSEIYIAPWQYEVHSLYIVLKQNGTQGVGERCGTIACPDLDGSVKLSELFTNNGIIAIYFKGH